MRKLGPFKTFTLGALALLTAAATADAEQTPPDAADLRPQWQPGHTSQFETWSKRTRNTTLAAAGQSREQQVTIENQAHVTWHVQRTEPDGSAHCTMTYHWMTSTLTSPDGEQLHNDSRQSTGDIPPMHQLLRAITGNTIRVQINPDGSIRGVSGLGPIQNALPDQQMMPDEQEFHEAAARLILLAGPPSQAQPADSWNAHQRWTHELGHLEYNLNTTLQSIDRIENTNLATITSRAQPTLEVDHTQAPADAPPIDVRLSHGNYISETLFDMDRRETLGRNINQSLTIDVTISLPEATLQQTIHETVQNQVLRVAEE